MIVEETFFRPDESGRETRTLPADLYNLAHVLLTRAPNGCLFVPIRSMQYLAVLDAEEFIFVDREGGRMIDVAWQRFRASEREALDAPVSYEAVYYAANGPETMRRLQGEFRKALQDMQGREPVTAAARIIPLCRTSR
jgi:hypothetical protein